MTQMQEMTERIVREALDEVAWRGMERAVAVRLPELCRDTVAAARLARLRYGIQAPALCQCAGECPGH